MAKKTLRQIRRERDITQDELAKRSGVTARTISNYETDTASLKAAKYETLSRIAKALGVTVDDIFLG